MALIQIAPPPAPLSLVSACTLRDLKLRLARCRANVAECRAHLADPTYPDDKRFGCVLGELDNLADIQEYEEIIAALEA